MLEIIMKIFNSTNLRKNDGYMKKMITGVNCKIIWDLQRQKI